MPSILFNLKKETNRFTESLSEIIFLLNFLYLLRRYLSKMPGKTDILSITQVVWEQGYEIAFSFRKKGLTIPATDLIIAAVAIENNSMILHHDEHYEMIAQYYPTLHTKYFGKLT